MHYLSVEGLTKAYGIQPLFDHISFHLSLGDKVALVARNGSGKSTLLKILAGKETPDGGEVWISKEIQVAYLDQDPRMVAGKTVIENIFDHDHPVLNAIKAYEALAGDATVAPEAMNAAVARMDALDAWNFESKVRQILGKLAIGGLGQPVETLSGGQIKRLALAKLLIDTDFDHRHSLLILDEPTNHLDVSMIEWLENYLSRAKVTLLMVTHDRYFLDNVCKEILELDGGKLFSSKGDYAHFLEIKAARQEDERSGAEKARNKLRRELEWVRRQPRARTTKSKSRLEAYEQLKKRTDKVREPQEMVLSSRMSRLGGKVLEMKKVYKAYGDRVILKGFDYTFKRGERIGIIGENGTGKTSFLKLMLGLEKPDSGKINTGETIVFGHYSQDGLVTGEDMRVIEFVKSIAENFLLADGTKVSASEFLNLFLFPPEQQYTYLSSLSGGERKRLQLLGVLFRNPNFLLMDEPTNDLDLQTLDILDEFLLQFQGCVVMVSHDRYFMDRLVDHIFVFEGEGKVRDFPGNYSQYREDLKKGASPRTAVPLSKPAPAQAAAATRLKRSYREGLELEKLEKEIGSLESEKNGIEIRMGSGEMSYDDLQQLSIRLTEVISQLEDKTGRWIELSEK